LIVCGSKVRLKQAAGFGSLWKSAPALAPSKAFSAAPEAGRSQIVKSKKSEAEFFMQQTQSAMKSSSSGTESNNSNNPNFREARRIQQSYLANLEKRTLIWLAARTPAWINSDHLTVLGLLSMAAAGAAYWWAATNRAGLILVIVCLALNWLGDSLDGTLARFRDHSRPRYGFYVDHIVDAFSAFFLLGGLALSGYMAPIVALGLLIAYLMLSVEIYLASYTLGDFKISYFKMGPTELRILLSIGNLATLWKSTVYLLGRAHRLFDVAGTLGLSGIAARG
jgi:archaetidylinositol phosphate synthase